MLTLTLFRHAKSSWNSPADGDHRRPLNSRGLRDAPSMAEALLKRNLTPDRCLVSTATRTQQTLAALAQGGLVAESSVQYYDELYQASAERILHTVQTDFLSQPTSPQHVLVLAHNPGLEELADKLSGSKTGAMPTAAVAHFQVNADDFAVLNTANTQLEYFISPKNLESANPTKGRSFPAE